MVGVFSECSELMGSFLFNFLFYIGVKLMSNVVLISVVQQSDSVMYTVPIFLKMFICLSQRLAVVYGL